MKISIYNSFLVVFSGFMVFFFNVVFAQNYNQDGDTVIFGPTEKVLTKAIKSMNTRKAATAYNIANVTTPGFKPIRFQDEIDEAIRLYGNTDLLEEVNIDDEMVKTTKIRLKHQAYIRLLSTKMAITKRVVTLGKGG